MDTGDVTALMVLHPLLLLSVLLVLPGKEANKESQLLAVMESRFVNFGVA